MVNTISKELFDNVVAGGFLHCKDLHDHSCNYAALEKFLVVMKIAAKFYFPIHVIPMLIFRFKKLKEQ